MYSKKLANLLYKQNLVVKLIWQIGVILSNQQIKKLPILIQWVFNIIADVAGWF